MSTKWIDLTPEDLYIFRHHIGAGVMLNYVSPAIRDAKIMATRTREMRYVRSPNELQVLHYDN